MISRLRPRLLALALPLALAALPALGVGTESGSSATPDTKARYTEAQAAIDKADYSGALKTLATVIKAEPRNADALNLMGYAHRKLKHYSEADRYYSAALKADPRHRGALEYQGELFVETGAYDKARANLNRLSAVCGTCAEFEDLRAALMAAGQG